jgi:D-glycero-alpha-D-manno-heptose-7-phosphate kinase
VIIVQTPLRISFFGGGTDFPAYYREEGGCVLTSAIDKYIFVTVKKRFDQKLRIGYTQTEMVDSIDQINHELIREALRLTGIRNGIEVTTMGDIPSAGSGLGSSSTVTVGSLHAMYSLLGEMVTAEQLAQEACQIELDILNKPIGVQDQYIAAYGGTRFFEFNRDGCVVSQKVRLDTDTLRTLNENLMLFFTGVTREAGRILGEQRDNINNRLSVLRRMKDLAHTAWSELQRGHPDAVGELLDEGWQLKKQLASQITNPEIETMYRAARDAGATGGKITGAGGGGFLMVYCPHRHQERLRRALRGLQELPFGFENDGTKVIFNYHR